MSYRFDQNLADQYGERADIISKILRGVSVHAYEGDDVARVNIDQDETGEVSQDTMDQFTQAGYFARPAKESQVEAVVGNLGASADGAVVIGILDHGRFTVLDAESIDASTMDVAMLYNLSAKVLIKGGEIHAAQLGVDGESLAFTSDATSIDDRVSDLEDAFNSLVTAYNGAVTAFASHAHTGVTAGMASSGPPASATFPPGVPANTNATINGTTVLKAK